LRQAGEALRRVILFISKNSVKLSSAWPKTAIVASGGQVPQKKDDYEH
jgi:hypothetical protein